MKKSATLFLATLMSLMVSNVKSQTTDTLLIGDTTNMVMGGIRLPSQSNSSSYTQELVLASELNGPAMITGLDLYCANANWGRQCTIYLANTYVSRLDSFVPYGAMFQQVVVDTLGRADGWNHFEFDTPFYYTGFGNLVVAFDCPLAMGGGDFYCEYTQNISRYADINLSYLTPTFPTTATGYRNIMRLHTQPAPASTCPAPTVLVDAVGSTEVSLRIPGGSNLSWSVECITDGDAAWRTGGYGTSDTTYTMTGLTPSTHYTFRITNFCTDTFSTMFKHILTNCVPDTVPYVEDFEGRYSLPDCLRSTPSSAGNIPELAWNHSHSGTYGVKLNGGTLILPLFDVPTDSLELSFWAQNGTVNATLNLYVGTVSDPLDPTTFVPVDTITVPRSWIPVIVRFDSHPGIGGQIAIRTANPVMTYMYIDDIEVHRITPCQTITTVSVGAISDIGAVVHWVDSTAMGSGADSIAVEYEVAYGTQGFTIDSTYIVTGIHTDSLLLTGLMPYTVYDIYVRSDCDGGYTHWSPVRSFRTLCSLLDTLPYTEDFDAYTGYPKANELPCWSWRVDMNTCVMNPAGGGHSGNRALRWEWSIYDAAVQTAALPAINTTLLPLNTLQLSFWAKNAENIYHMYDTARVVVGVMTDPDVDSTFQPVDTLVILGDDWHRYDVMLNGTGNYVVIKSISGLGTRGQWRAFIDDILIDLAPPCPEVTGMTLTALTATTATVRWDGQEEGTRWQVCIGTDDTMPLVTDTTSLTTPEYTFTDLVTGTPYYVWVRSLCIKGDTSQWEGPLQVVPGVWNMRANKHDALSLCGVTVYDNGGAADHFSAQHSSLVIMPDAPGHLVSIGGHCDIGSVSSLTIYDGVGTSGTVLWTKSVNNMWPVDFGPVVSETGPITLAFEGNTSFNYYNDGFELSVNCIPDTCIVHQLRLDTTVAASDTTLALTWDCNGASSYEVEYGPVNFAPGEGTLATTSSNSFVITGLSSLERLEVHVRSLCGEGDTGAWVRGIFNTEPCSDALFRDNYDSTMQYNLTSVGPVGYNGVGYSYVQTLVSPEHLAGLEEGLTALAFHPGTYVEGSHMSNVTVWLANVADTALNDGPILPDADHRFIKVIDSGNFCHTATTEWQTLRFDRPFLWDGHSTLLVAALREDGGDTSVVTHYSCHFRHRDLMDTVYRSYQIAGYYPIDIDSAGSYTTPYYGAYGTYLTGDLRLIGNPCGTMFCEAPVIDSITTDSTSVTIVWHGTGNDYQLTISPDSQGLGIISITDTTSHFSPLTFHLTGLQPSTNYRVSLRQNCTAADLGYSDWVSVDVTTDSAASQPIGIDNVSTYQPINIYPNPTHGKVTVKSSEALVSVTVNDMMGRQVYTTQPLCNTATQSLTMDLSHLPQGAYFLTLTTADGRQHIVRLLKQP
ncbi:MAG: fibronectin type III domain-containing protein [Bacteroidales bacterium]|nr:fibronectin type III domain-containing protein [Bacteroidales bacterium]